MSHINNGIPFVIREMIRRRNTFFILSLVCLFWSGGYSDSLIPRDKLAADVKQLAETIESVHPDPYRNVSGKDEWERRLREVISDIPEPGMSLGDFYFLLCPIVTGLDDAHTWLRAPDEFSYGLPLYLGTASDAMYVVGAPSEYSGVQLGARLISIQGVSVDEIVKRAKCYVSAENDFQILRNLGGNGMLFNKWWLDRVVPECKGQPNINVAFLQENGDTVSELLECGKYTDPNSYALLTSQFSKPSRKRSDFVYQFTDSSKQTMLLIIDDLNTYREAFEMWRSEGRLEECRSDASDLYRRYKESDPPNGADDAALIFGLPSATETFTSMCREMKQAGTRTLIVDLRRNEGGNSAMAEILLYFLYGKERLLEAKTGQTEMLRCSPLYIERHPGINVEDIRLLPGVVIDSGNYAFHPISVTALQTGMEVVRHRFEEWAKSMPTFYAEYTSGVHSGCYQPENVFVLSSVNTFSSGFTMMYYLYRAGAKIVGVPSAQAANCFGETLDFELTNSGLYFTVSCKYYEKFPGDTVRGRVLMPDYPLTYKILAAYDFDLNASILYAMDLATRAGSGGQ